MIEDNKPENFPHRIAPVNEDYNCVAGVPLAVLLEAQLVHPRLLAAGRIDFHVLTQRLREVDEKCKKNAYTRMYASLNKVACMFWGTVVTVILSIISYGLLESLPPLLIGVAGIIFFGAQAGIHLFRASTERYKVEERKVSSFEAGLLRKLDTFVIDTNNRLRETDSLKLRATLNSAVKHIYGQGRQRGIFTLSPDLEYADITQYLLLGLDVLVYKIVQLEVEQPNNSLIDALRVELKEAYKMLVAFQVVDAENINARWREMFERVRKLYHDEARPS